MVHNNLNVSFFGDSICFGLGVSINKIWVYQIAEKLEKDLRGYDIVPLVQNYSINGNTTRMALERMPIDIQCKNIDVLVVQLGINDCNFVDSDKGVSRVSIKAFEANLEEIIDRAMKSGVKKIILNTNHPLAICEDKIRFAGITYYESNRRYNEIIRNVARGKSDYVIVVDMEKCLLQNAEMEDYSYLLDDLKHLSEKGHNLYFEYFYPILFETAKPLARKTRAVEHKMGGTICLLDC